MATGRRLGSGGVYHFGDTPSAPEVPEASPIQTTLPTSAYGQTIPVVWGRARVPAAYIWVPPIITITSSHQEYWDTITTTNSPMSCRLRFARPLVPNSTWTLRKLYCNGTLIYDAGQGYRAKNLKFRAYDGRNTQERDPTMTKEEGTNNVSAHRGYLDVVLTDFDIQGFGAPPVFEGEWIQDGAATHDYEDFTTYSGEFLSGNLVPVWDRSMLLGMDTSPGSILYYSIPAVRQYFSFDMPPDFSNYYAILRYSKVLDRIVYFGSFTGVGGWDISLLDGSTGDLLANPTDEATPGIIGDGCLVDIGGNASIVVGFSLNTAQIFCFAITNEDHVTRAFQSSTGWNGYSDIQCITRGEVRGEEADIFFCADSDLIKATFSSTGIIKSTRVMATLAYPLRYAIYDDDGDIVVWTNSATVSRIDGTTGALEYTKTVPYQIQTIDVRELGSPDLQRLTEEFYFTPGSVSYFTDLKTGATRQMSGADSGVNTFYFDGETQTVITITSGGKPRRIRFIAGDGNLRRLSDLLSDLMVYGGGYELSEVSCENVTDLIQGAVVDITAGTRDIARAICEPYSVAIFERSGVIIFKRALTDGAFTVDQVISSAGDIVDQ